MPYVLSYTDRLSPPSLALEVIPALAATGVPAPYVEIDSEDGHLASGTQAMDWATTPAPLLDDIG